jgi:diguanylate cyclase (GGDEF)-like protein/PAS domain S-box-containing protein
MPGVARAGDRLLMPKALVGSVTVFAICIGPVSSKGDMSLLTVGGSRDHSGEELIAVLAEARAAASDIALVTDATQAIIHVSASFTAMTGYELAELQGHNCRILQGPGTDKSTVRRMKDLLASGEVFEGQILNYRKDGSAFWTALKIIPMRVGAGTAVTHFVSVQSDISNEVALLKQLEAQALHDHVTGLPNRAAAEQAVEEVTGQAPEHRITVAVGLIDLDDFRIVNNTLGHAAGDAVLQQWATRVLSRLREGDVLARMGGDEFLLILRNITRDTAHKELPHILDRLHESVEAPFRVDGQDVRIGMSLGIALVPEDGTDSRTLLRSADEALYTVKKRISDGHPWWKTATHASASAHPRTHPHPGYRSNKGATAVRLGVEGLKEAGAEVYRDAVRSGNVLVHFQPIVDLRDGSVTLFEALARLQLPAGEIAYPVDFLPQLGAEDLRILFARVLDAALGLIAAWNRDGVRPNVSVNLPPEILHDQTLPALVEELLRTHNIEPGGLGLELLESQLMELEEQRIALQNLAGLGISLAMDDLGSGYSSLQRLASFPFSAIKLDRGLFTRVYDKPLETLSVMATLVQMGRDLDMTVVIEGLEDEGLTEAAMILGAPLGQGYYFSPPLASEDCGPWFDFLDFQLHRSPIQTSLGALAYHWQFARLAAPHPLDLPRCPLTRFIGGIGAAAEVVAWHALQHSPQGMHPASSRFLINWFTHRIRIHGSPHTTPLESVSA